MQKKIVLIFCIFTIIFSQIFDIHIVGTNDIHGAGLGTQKEITVNNQRVTYQIGGYKLLSGLISIVKSINPKGFLWLDAGDQYQGAREGRLTQGMLMTTFYNTMQVDASALGNHEWDDGKVFLGNYINSATQYDYLIANISRKTNQQIAQEQVKLGTDQAKIDELNINIYQQLAARYRGTFPTYKIVYLQDRQIKVGIIGLTTNETYSSSSKPPLDMDISADYANIINNLSQRLRNTDQVHVVIVVSHVGIMCFPDDFKEFKTYKVRTEDDPINSQIKCNQKEIAQIIQLIPKGTVDAWVAGHVHDTVHNFINGIPIIQNPNGGKFTNVIKLQIQKDADGSVKVLRNKTEIWGPIPLCDKVFEQTNQCEFLPKDDNLQMKDFLFQGQKLLDRTPENVKQIFQTAAFQQHINQIQIWQSNILFTIDQDFTNEKLDFNPLGALFTQAFKKAYLRQYPQDDISKVIVICGWGGFRVDLQKGPISQLDIMNMFPFEGTLVKVEVSGSQMIEIIKILQSGRKPFYTFYGVKMKVKIDPYRVVKDSITLTDGSQINESDVFQIITYEFNIRNGGDDFSKVQRLGLLTNNYQRLTLLNREFEAAMMGLENRLYTLDELKKQNLYLEVEIDCPDNCKQCSDTSKCTLCNDGFKIQSDGQCVKINLTKQDDQKNTGLAIGITFFITFIFCIIVGCILIYFYKKHLISELKQVQTIQNVKVCADNQSEKILGQSEKHLGQS